MVDSTKVKDAPKEQPIGSDSPSPLHQDGPPKSTPQIAKEWDAAFSARDGKAMLAAANDAGTAGLTAYESGGIAGLAKLQTNLNKAIVSDGAGPAFVVRANTIEVHNIQVLTDAQADKLPALEKVKLGALDTAAGTYSNVRELTNKVSLDKPETQGIKLKPGQKLSPEFPSEYLIAKALQAGGLDQKDWMSSNPEQKYLTTHLSKALSELPNLPKDILDGMAQTGGVDKLNKFLADHKMDMRLDPIGPTDVGMAAVLSLKGSWQGQETSMNIDGKDFPAALIKHVETFKVNGVDVVKLYEKDGVSVYAAPIGNDKLTSYQATERAHSLTPNDSSERGDATSVLTPKVYKNVQTDLPGIQGWTATDGTSITQAKMQTVVALDQNGFSATQGVALAATRSLEISPTMVLKGPYVMWATAKGVSDPLFATVIEQKDFKDPKRTNG